ncbi:MAG: tRNA uridine-5-carboxymethylaminomethyl(34) synthesis enzyme MnmG [Clostridia bacterium]|nr:tRNA uridine-5-carboxymethylaminomethyl(34) synthesis enzyme MnmG [Clostridia bacterium]
MHTETFDVVVIGAGHAGCEAALASGRMGLETLLITLNLDALAMMPCNHSIGGTAKGHLVREVDALGGEMGRAIDDVFIQSRMLNTRKGPAVHSLRAQADKKAYQRRMRRAVDDCPNLTLRQGEVRRIVVENGRVTGIETTTGGRAACRAVIVCCGVYLNSRIIIGECSWNGGPQGLMAANALTEDLMALGFSVRRFKTGTPARLDGRTIDFSAMTPQAGDEPVVPFSFLTDPAALQNRALCYLTYTTPRTHEIILNNLHRAPMYSGAIHGTGARYCPSIEDKVVRFSDKDRHPIFMEPEGLDTNEWYAQGMSTSMPEDVQREIYASIPGLERARLLRLAYAIEYDCIDPTQLNAALEARHVRGLFCAGQLHGTSGSAEAAAQGLYAGINAALFLQGKPPMLLTRADAYLGVLVDDLVTKGVDEPYRMMTSRAEYRLLLRQDNADLRLTEKGHEAGLASKERLEQTLEKRRLTDEGRALLEKLRLTEALRHPESSYRALRQAHPQLPDYPPAVVEQLEIDIRYEGYLARQEADRQRFLRMEDTPLPPDADWLKVSGLRIEARQKLDAQRPRSLGQASRIPGINPGDVTVLMIWLKSREQGLGNEE